MSPFPKPLPGVKMRAKVGDELWSAGSAEWERSIPTRRRAFFGMLRCQGSSRWRCDHLHLSSAEARACAAEELAERLNPMTKGPLGYGRYKDDPNHVGCPRAKIDMTPCVARDGRTAMADETCVGCDQYPADLLRDLVRDVTEP